jgi:hypothetical protein
VGACCKPNRGKMVRGITFCVCFVPLNHLISLFCANFRQGCERRTLATLKTTAQNVTGVYLTCTLSLACQFGSLCVCGSVFFFSWALFVSPLNLLASLSCTCYNFAHRGDNCANVGLKLDGICVFRIDRLRRDRKHFLEPCVTFC